jgi:predicted deacylase
LADEYPVEISPPDLAPHRGGNTGIDFTTTYQSDRPGPHVLVTALVHGNELCGAIVLDQMIRAGLRPTRGRLTLAFCNVAAFARFDRANPSSSRFVDEDFNRLWTPEVLDGPRNSTELARARALRPVVDSADFLLDIHSMQHDTAPLLLAGPLAKGRHLARQVGVPSLVVCDEGHAAGRRMRDYGGFGDPQSDKNALLVECGQHWRPNSVAVATETLLRFLLCLEVVDRDFTARHLPQTVSAARQRVIEVTHAVTIRTDRFKFARDFKGLELIGRAGTEIARDDTEPVRTPYDSCVLIMPTRRILKGQTAVRLGRYVN